MHIIPIADELSADWMSLSLAKLIENDRVKSLGFLQNESQAHWNQPFRPMPSLSHHQTQSRTDFLHRWSRRVAVLVLALPLLAVAQEQAAEKEPPPPIPFKVLSERQIALPEQQRKMVIQRVVAPVLPAPPAAEPKEPIDPEVLEQRRAAWRALAPVETRLLSLTAIVYENGWTFLSWWHHDDEGKFQTFEAWSQTDFRSLWMVPDFEVNDVRYIVFPMVLDASWKYSGSRNHPLPGPLSFEGTPGYRLVKGDASNTKALNPITALHEIYRNEGPLIATLWAEVEKWRAADEAWRKANPPVPKDTVIRMWPKKSRRHAADGQQIQPSTAPAAR